MYKIASFARFSRELDPAAVLRHWRAEYAAMVRSIPGVARYAQNRLLGPPPGVMGPPPGRPGGSEKQRLFDVYACLWFADEPAFETATTTSQWKHATEDAASFLDLSSAVTVPVDERVIKEGDHAPFKEVSVFLFKEGMEKEDASDHWANIHGPLGVAAAPDFTRYVQNHVLEDIDGSTLRSFDGFAEHWFRNEEAYVRTIDSPKWKECDEDGYNFIDMTDIWQATVDELIIGA
jgi:uncharacterized protein (TIGR02118 family)